jgi:hypothetical protein
LNFSHQITLLPLVKQQSKNYFLRHKWDLNTSKLLSWAILVLSNDSITTNPFDTDPKTYIITITHNIPNMIPNSTRLEAYPNYRSPQLWLIKVFSMTHNSPNSKTFPKRNFWNIFSHKSGFPIHRPIFLWSSHLHMSHFLSTPNN